MASRRGFGVRLDKAGTRAGGGKAVDIETYVTEYLRDKLLDAEEQLKSGGGDTRLVQQRLSAMEAEVAAAVRLHAEVEMLRSQVHDKNEQIALLKPVSDGETVRRIEELLDPQQEKIRALEQENAIITRERELGVSAVGGSVSQERYDQLVAENKRLQLDVERGDAGGGGGGGMGKEDLDSLKQIEREVKQMKKDRDALQQRYEEEVQKNRELQTRGAVGGVEGADSGTMRELRENLARQIVENKRLNAAAEGSHQVMFDVQRQIEEKEIEIDKLRVEKDTEIGALQHNLRQLTEDWGKEKDALLWQQRDDHKGLEEQLTRESADNVKLQSMLEELATSLENVASEKQHWQTRAEHAESDLAVAHQLAGIPNFRVAAVANVPGAGQPGLPPAPQQQAYADPTAHVAPASVAMLAPPPGAGGYQYAGQPQTHQAPSVASGYGP